MTAATPTPSEMRAPYRMVERMSRPWSSLPRRKADLPSASQTGGLNASSRLTEARSKGLCGATQGANSAPPTHSNAAQAAAIVTGEWRKL